MAFDFRPAAGGLVVAPELTERMRAARAAPGFHAPDGAQRDRVSRRARVPRPARDRAAAATAAGRLDLKRGAIIPLVNLVRFHALAHGVTISPTLDRIEAVASVGGIEPGSAEALTEAFG